jgi:hypothetical protein
MEEARVYFCSSFSTRAQACQAETAIAMFKYVQRRQQQRRSRLKSVLPRQQAMLVYSESNRKVTCVIDPQAISNRCSLGNYCPYKAFMEERPTSM